MQAQLRDGTLSEESTWQTVVLIPKGASRDFRGFGLVELLWKSFTSLLNRQLASSIKFHDALHRFRAVQGAGTATLKAKLLQQIMAIREALLFKVLLDLHNSYDALYKDRCLEIFAAYGVGPRTI